VQQQARNAEAQLSLNAVARAAGEHAHARAPHGRTGRDGHAVGIDGDARHALAVRQLCARQSGALRKASIEPGPIDDDRFDRDRRVIDGIARRGMKADRPQLIEDAVVGETNRSNASAASTPVQCTGMPLVGCSSQIATEKPARASVQPAYSPAGPPPTMTTS